MPTKNPRTVYLHRSFRIREDVVKRIQDWAKRTGWSESKMTNAWLAAAAAALSGDRQALIGLNETLSAAEQLETAHAAQERILAPLRKKAADARKALAPLVQRIATYKGVTTSPIILPRAIREMRAKAQAKAIATKPSTKSRKAA
jgi:hypothetical protein